MHTLQKFIIDLQSLDPESDYLVGELYDLIDEIEGEKDLIEAVPDIFEFMESSPNADLGAPGPLVHLLEEIESYEKYLYESIERRPVYYTVTMLKRRLNHPDIDNEIELQLLKKVLNHTKASEDTKVLAKEYLNDH